jgi:hypothetical protein
VARNLFAETVPEPRQPRNLFAPNEAPRQAIPPRASALPMAPAFAPAKVLPTPANPAQALPLQTAAPAEPVLPKEPGDFGKAIDTSRPILDNKNGSFSTERTITIEMDGRVFNIPTIHQGVQRTPDEAVELFRRGEIKPTWEGTSNEDGVAAAKARSSEINRLREAEFKGAAQNAPKPAYLISEDGVPINKVTGKADPEWFNALNNYDAPLGWGDTAKLLGRAIWEGSVYHTPAAVAAAVEGTEPFADDDWKDRLIERARSQSNKRIAEQGEPKATAIPGIDTQDIESLAQSLGFSATAAVAGIGAGVPAGVAGSAATPAVGAVTGYGAGGAASGAAAYRMATNQFARDLAEAANEESIERTGKPLSKGEIQEKQAALSDAIKEYGLWEAIPEAASNVVGFGVLKAPIKGAIGKLFGNNVATRLATKMGALYGTELATETITQTGQHNVEIDTGLSTGDMRSFKDGGDVAESFREIAPVTALQTTIMAGGAKAGMMLDDARKKRNIAERTRYRAETEERIRKAKEGRDEPRTKTIRTDGGTATVTGTQETIDAVERKLTGGRTIEGEAIPQDVAGAVDEKEPIDADVLLGKEEIQPIDPEIAFPEVEAGELPQSKPEPPATEVDESGDGVSAANQAVRALNDLNPQLNGALRVESLSQEEMNNRGASDDSDGLFGDLVGGHYGSTLTVVGNPTLETVAHEVRHMIDMLLGGSQVTKYLESDSGMASRAKAFLESRRTEKDLRGRLTNAAEVAQTLLDQYFRNPGALEKALPDMFQFLEESGAGKYRAVIESIYQHGVKETAAPTSEVARGSSDVQLLDPDTIEVDAKTFQFKSDTDDQGVSRQLKGTKQWDDKASGVSIVWERSDGTRFIVDGHQRLGLAKKLKAEGQDAKIRALVLREADGVTAADARDAGAIKNLQEGGESTKPVDVAKVLRSGVDAETVADVIPPNRAAFKEGRSLAKLGEDAWFIVVNEQVESSHAAIVGDRIRDPAEQVAALGVLQNASPANATQAGFIIDQVIDVGFQKKAGDAQDELPGIPAIVESIVGERAKILDGAIRRLRSMRAMFNNAVTNKASLEKGGNVLDNERNQAKVSENAELIYTLQQIANSAGPISDALSQAARGHKGGNKLSNAIDQFLEAVAKQGATDSAQGDSAGTGDQEAVDPGPSLFGEEPPEPEKPADPTKQDPDPISWLDSIPGANEANAAAAKGIAAKNYVESISSVESGFPTNHSVLSIADAAARVVRGELNWSFFADVVRRVVPGSAAVFDGADQMSFVGDITFIPENEAYTLFAPYVRQMAKEGALPESEYKQQSESNPETADAFYFLSGNLLGKRGSEEVLSRFRKEPALLFAEIIGAKKAFSDEAEASYELSDFGDTGRTQAEKISTPPTAPKIGDKVWHSGDELTITTEPYDLYGGEFQDAVTEDGKTVTIATPKQRDDNVKRSESDRKKRADAAKLTSEAAKRERESGKPEKIPLLEGDVFETTTGRHTGPFPKFYKRTSLTEKRLREWLKAEAIAEAKSRNDEFNLLQFERLDVNNWSPADGDSVNQYLFDDPDGRIGNRKVSLEDHATIPLSDGGVDSGLLEARELLRDLAPNGRAYDLFGPSNKSARQAVMSALLGRKVSVADSGINKLLSELYSRTGIQGGTLAARQEKLDEWVIGGRKTDLDEQAHQAATSPTNALPEPTDAQIEAGNYPKGHIQVHGLDITIEHPKGSTREGTGRDGKEWQSILRSHYGYLRGTRGADSPKTGKPEQVDVFVGDNPESTKAFVVDQMRTDGNKKTFDEHKIMLGFDSMADAKAGYLANYEKNWDGLGGIVETDIEGLKDWLENGDQTKRAFPQIKFKKVRTNKPVNPPKGKVPVATEGAIQQHDNLMKALYNGDATPADLQDDLKRLTDSKDEIVASLQSITKQQLLKRMGGMAAARNKNEKKDRVVDAAYRGMLDDLILKDIISYQPFGGGPTYADAITEMVSAYTESDISDFAAKVAKAREAKRERFLAFKKAIENPETLDEFETFVRSNGEGALTAEQAKTFDELRLQNRRESEEQQAATRATVAQVEIGEVGMELVETEHTRDNYPLFVVKLSDLVEKETYRELLAAAKRLGGWYSRYNKDGAVPGFQFKQRESAEQFMRLREGSIDGSERVAERTIERKEKAKNKLRALAERMTAKAQASLQQDRRTNTARQSRMASSAEASAEVDIATAATMGRIADAYEAGELKFLDKISAKTQIDLLDSALYLARVNRQRAKGMTYAQTEKEKGLPYSDDDIASAKVNYPGGYKENLERAAVKLATTPGAKLVANRVLKYVRGHPDGAQVKFHTAEERELFSGFLQKLKAAGMADEAGWYAAESIKNYDRLKKLGVSTDSDLRSVLREYVTYRQAARGPDPIKTKERELFGKKIPGFFPTPPAVVDRMLQEAGIEPGMDVLEPSAGKGNIADAIKREGVEPVVLEINPTLRDLLELKGYELAGRDFMEYSGAHDLIIMNPPFEKGQDIDHVRHAYGLLNPGGRIVSIMSDGPFFRSDKKASEFREWIDSVGWSEKLPTGSFANTNEVAQTGTSSRIVVIDKAEGIQFSKSAGAATGITRADTIVAIEAKAGKGAVSRMGNALVIPENEAELRADMQRRGSDFTGMMFATGYHGTPHTFDKFSLEKIGTGEGAQAYGYGIYVAENPDVAGTYRYPGQQNDPYIQVGDRKIGPSFDNAKSKAEKDAAFELIDAQGDYKLARTRVENSYYKPEQILRELDALESSGARFGKKPKGSLYKVDLPDSAIDKMLDWDAPLSELPESTQTLIVNQFSKSELGTVYDDFSVDMSGEDFYKWAGPPEEVSEALKELGIPGIKYFDGGSRSSGKGTRNFVIFDPDILTITHRNGEPVTQAEKESLVREPDDFQLDPHTEADVKARQDKIDAADQAARDEALTSERKTKADREAGDFELTGSDLPADAKPRQKPLFSRETPGTSEYDTAADKGLDMSKEARMKRARAMGFDTETVWYHGTGKDESKNIKAFGFLPSLDGGIYFTSSPREAFRFGYEYSPSSRKTKIEKVLLGINRPLVVEFGGELFEPSMLEDAINRAKGGGYDGVIARDIKNFEGGEITDTAIVFNPNQIRSINAAFDPDQAESGGLLFSRAPATDTPAFKAWFGNSKVVDSQGAPLVVYHGTTSDFNEFLPWQHFGSSSAANQRLADIVDTGQSAVDSRYREVQRILPAYLSIRNPLRLNDAGTWGYKRIIPTLIQAKILTSPEANRILRKYNNQWATLKKETWRYKDGYEQIIESKRGDLGEGLRRIRNDSQKEIQELIEKAGFDGIVYINEYEHAIGATDSYIAFRPTQIKSAIGNRGTFDPKDPSILRSYAGAEAGEPSPIEGAKGFYDPSTDTSYILPWNLSSEDEAYSVFLHEVGVHYGMESMLGDNYADTLSQVEIMARMGGEKIMTAMRQVNESENLGLDPKAKTFRNQFADLMQSDKRVAEETIAYLVQNNHEMSFVRRVLAAIRAFLHRIGIHKALDVDSLVALARAAAKRGKKVEQPVVDGAPVAASTATTAPTFYSALLRAVTDSPQAKATPDQWRAHFKKSGVKQEEIDWLDLDEFLAGKKSVTRDELTEFVGANEVEVEEVIKRGWGAPDYAEMARERFEETWPGEFEDWLYESNKNAIEDAWDNPDHLIWESMPKTKAEYLEEARDDDGDVDEDAARESYGDDADELDVGAYYSELEWGEMTSEAWSGVQQEYEQEARRSMEDEARAAELRGDAKFEQQQLPGGENYRELVLTLPVKEDRVSWRAWAKGQGIDEGEVSLAELESRNAPKDVITSFQQHMFPAMRTEASFDSPHFDEPNVLAHVRFNERTDADGNRVLFIEEIQSDWHQAGRKRGYAGGGPRQRFEIYRLGGERLGIYDTKEEAEAWLEQALSATVSGSRGFGIRPVMDSPPGAVPDAPFKKTWPLLTIKRMIRYAAENGFDSVAWTTGEQQADRYDLSEQVDEVRIVKHDDGTFDVSATKNREGSRGLADVLLSEERISSDRLASYVGKDLAEKAREQIKKEEAYTGFDLKVGGEGMKSFYDKMLPSMVNKYVKKWGGRVSEAEIGGQAPATASDIALLDELGVEGTGKPATKVHALPITPAMRQSVMQGQPLFSRNKPGDPVEPLFPGFDLPSETVVRAIQRRLQDKFGRVKTLERAIERAFGKPLPDELRPYLYEELFYGKTEDRLKVFDHKYVDKLKRLMSVNGVSLEELDRYLYARHAPERNAYIQSIRDDAETGSGMSDEEARLVMDDFETDGRIKALERVASVVDEINDRRLDHLVDYGLLKEQDAIAWRARYDHYVPLRGFEEPDIDAEFVNESRTGRGFDIRGPESRQALGRESEAESPTLYSVMQAQETIVRAEKNEVGKALFRLVATAPNDKLWKVTNAAEHQKAVMGPDGKVTYRADPKFKLADNVLSVKYKGKEYYIELKDEGRLLARAFKNLGAEKAGHVLRFLMAFNRYQALINTALSPEFVFSNFVRDLQTAGINSIDVAEKLGIKPSRLAATIGRDVLPAIKGAFEGLRSEEGGGDWATWFREFRAAGGKIGFFGLDTIDAKRKRIIRELELMKGGPAANAEKAVRAVGDMIIDINGAVENGARLALYANLRRGGVSKPKAASAARNLTVNFNRKGELGHVANGLYLFYNAGIQGPVRLLQALASSRKVQAAGAGITIGAFLLTEMNRLMGGDDDEGNNRYDQIPDHMKQRNIIIMRPEGEPITLPLPYGYNIFHALGETLNSTLHGKDPMKAAIHLTDVVIESFNPLGTEDSESLLNRLMKMASPTILDPALQLSLNENFYGGKIMKEPPPYEKFDSPRSAHYWTSTSATSKEIAKQLNELTGGNEVRPGKMDRSPDEIEHVAGFLTGSAGKFILNSVDSLQRAATGQELESRKTPFLRRMIYPIRPYFTQKDAYFENRNEIRTLVAEEEYFSEHDPEVAREILDKHIKELQLADRLEDTDKERSGLEKERQAALAEGTPAGITRAKEIEARIGRLLGAFNKAVAEARSPARDPARSGSSSNAQ